MVRWFEIGRKVDTFEKALEDILLTKSLSYNKQRIVNVSSIFSHCFRKDVLCSVLKISQAEEVTVPRSMNLQIGRYIHGLFQQQILPELKIIGRWINCKGEEQVTSSPGIHLDCNSFCWTYRELQFSKDLGYGWSLVGHPDGIVYFQDKWYLIELKTINGVSFKGLSNVVPEHYAQIQIYLYLAKEQFPDIFKAKCVYINKDYNRSLKCEFCGKSNNYKSAVFKSFDVDYNSQYVEQILQELQTIKQLYNKTMPDRICKDFNDGYRKKCPVVTQCFNDFIARNIVIDDKVINQVEGKL